VLALTSGAANDSGGRPFLRLRGPLVAKYYLIVFARHYS
jgi:hypothetical protein